MKAIDTAEAARCPGVVRIFTHGRHAEARQDRDARGGHPYRRSPPRDPVGGPGGRDRTRRDAGGAEQAAALVRVEIAPSPALMPGQGKHRTGAGRRHLRAARNQGQRRGRLAEADTVCRRAYYPADAQPQPDGDLRVRGGMGRRSPHAVGCEPDEPAIRSQVMAAAFAIPKENVRIISPHTGGGFGCKGYVWPHVVLAAAAAKVAGRPVRLQLTRSQQYAMVGHQPECRQTVTLGRQADGTADGDAPRGDQHHLDQRHPVRSARRRRRGPTTPARTSRRTNHRAYQPGESMPMRRRSKGRAAGRWKAPWTSWRSSSASIRWTCA